MIYICFFFPSFLVSRNVFTLSIQVQGGSARDIRKKNYVAAAMSIEFVSYYLSACVGTKHIEISVIKYDI